MCLCTMCLFVRGSGVSDDDGDDAGGNDDFASVAATAATDCRTHIKASRLRSKASKTENKNPNMY